MRRSDRWIGCLAAATVVVSVGIASAGPIYRQVDGDGRITFTDTPQPGAERLMHGTGNTYRAPPEQQLIAQMAEPIQAQSEAFAGYESVTIDWPAEEAIRANDGRIRVVASTQPEMRPGHRATLLLDGQIVQQGDDLTFDLTDVNRGTHELTVRIVNDDGHVLAQSRPKVVHVLRAFRQNALK